MPISITSDNKISRAPGEHTATIHEGFRSLQKDRTWLVQAQMAQFPTEAITRAVLANSLDLTSLRHFTVAEQTANAPLVTTDPNKVSKPVSGADGTVYFVPQARLARRSKITDTPYVFFERRSGEFYLQAWFELVRFSSIRTQSKPLPIDRFSVVLSAQDNQANKIKFERVDELPPSEGSDSILSQLYCEAKVTDLDQAVDLLQNGIFRIGATVHYTLQGKEKERKPAPGFQNPWRSIPSPQVHIPITGRSLSSGRQLGGRVQRAVVNRSATHSASATRPVARGTNSRIARATPKPAARTAPVKKSRIISLGAHDGTGVRANFSPELRKNRPIYAQLGSGFGSQPWSEWVESPNGRFIESPVPDQFYVLADEYRLNFNPESGMPAMEVLLVPPDQPSESGPTSFSSDYKFRCRFGIVPWLDPARAERLREEIANHSGISHPKLLIGGAQGAACELSKTYDSLGSSLVGEADSAIEVDPLGFDLVMDCTSEFYRLLSRLLVNDGVTADLKLTLMKDAADAAPVETVPVRLRLDRPAGSSLRAELVQPTKDGDDESLTMPSLRISNHAVYDATVDYLSTTLLVTDESLPTPIGTVDATPTPSSFTIPAATADGPTTLEVALAPEDSSLPPFYGAADVGFIGLSLDIDPREVLDQVHDLGASTEIFSTIDIQSYQLANPESLPETHSDLFGIEAEFRRPEASEDEAVTAFLSLDDPRATVQVAFSVADLIEGAKPEQPKFSWRRRNMRGSGTGPWSEWEETIGRSLYIFPEGL